MTTDNDSATAESPSLPGLESQSGETVCPSCGRFVGTASKCPYCGAKAGKRMSLVAIRWAAVLLSTVGLVLLYAMARTRDPERIRIGDIEATMNFGLVRLSGEVKSNPRPFKNGNGMSFYVGDSSGSIIVFLDQAQSRAMSEGGLLPKKGDSVDFVAQLQSSASGRSARVRSLDPGSFSLERAAGGPAARVRDRGDGGAGQGGAPAPRAKPAAKKGRRPAVPVAEVSAASAGGYATVEGALSDPSDRAGKGMAYTLSDATGSIQVVFWTNAVPPELRQRAAAAARVRVNGKVGEYKGRLQVTPRAGGVEILE